jgi:hypothetical protein
MLRSIRSRTAALLALALLTGAALSAPAGPHTVPHRERCDAVMTALQPGSLWFTGQGVATHFGRYTIEGTNDFDDQGQVQNGQFTTTTADGATISGIYSGGWSVLPSGKIRFDVEVQWLQGTGRLQGVTGQADVVAILDGLFVGARCHYVTDGTLTFP